LPLRLRVPRATRRSRRARDAGLVRERARAATGGDGALPAGVPVGGWGGQGHAGHRTGAGRGLTTGGRFAWRWDPSLRLSAPRSAPTSSSSSFSASSPVRPRSAAGTALDPRSRRGSDSSVIGARHDPRERAVVPDRDLVASLAALADVGGGAAGVRPHRLAVDTVEDEARDAGGLGREGLRLPGRQLDEGPNEE